MKNSVAMGNYRRVSNFIVVRLIFVQIDSLKKKCLSSANIKQRHGRTIERSEYEEATIENRKRILRHREKYKRCQAIVEPWEIEISGLDLGDLFHNLRYAKPE